MVVLAVEVLGGLAVLGGLNCPAVDGLELSYGGGKNMRAEKLVRWQVRCALTSCGDWPLRLSLAAALRYF